MLYPAELRGQRIEEIRCAGPFGNRKPRAFALGVATPFGDKAGLVASLGTYPTAAIDEWRDLPE